LNLQKYPQLYEIKIFYMRKLMLSLGLVLSSFILFAQQTITITVTDSKTGKPVPNASVKIKSTSKGASTNENGTTTLQASASDILEISSIGYASREIKLSGQTNVNVSLESTAIEYLDIVAVGTRGAPRAKIETAVPVDVIRINQVGLPTAKMDLTSALNMAAPSFNYNKQSGADGADHVDLGTLRGLGPDQTLVLINGKRRHQTAFVALFGTRGRGNSGADLNAFPQSSVDRIEILRDGASAQYGSDAMAGVMNIVLKKDINHWSINTGWSGYYDNKFNASKFNAGNQYYSGNKIDGGTFSFSANNGFALGKNGGFVNISLDLLTQGKTYRQADTANWQTDKYALPYINGGRRAFGDGSVQTYGAMYNLEIPTSASKKTTFYSFAGYNYKSSDAFAYTRNWSAKPERFPVDMSGNLLYNADIMRTANDGEIYYNPHIQTHISDVSFAAGVKGACHNWNWDLSNTLGRNDFHFYGDKTFNASIFYVPNAQQQNHFNDGGFNFLQNTLNFDVSRAFKTVAQGLNLGLGAEYRYEHYSIYKGEDASFKNYHNTDIYYPNVMEDRTPASGSQGFPGFSPDDVIKSHRSNFSLYADGELNATKEWLLDAAIRFENYTDFGSVLTYKFATRYKVAHNFNIRGSVSTGFRAPSLQQINFSNTLTSFSGGNLVQSRIARNGDAITKAAGIPDLKEEKSVNASLGFAWKPMPGLTFTMDGYMVKVKDRIVLSGLFDKDDPTLPLAFRNQLTALGVQTAQFFDNAVNTTNYGLDVVADYTKKWDNKSFKILLAGNFQHMTVDAVHVPAALSSTVLNQKTFFSDREEAFLLASAPDTKLNLSVEYNFNKFGVGAHLTYFGKIKLMGFGDSTPDNPNSTGINPMVPTDADPNIYVPEVFDFKGKLVTDIFVSYQITKKISVFTGVDNIFNVHPNLGVNQLAKGWFGDNESGGPWDSVQMGFNGLRMFGKVSFNF
jgi:iron complex outermembrane receptor protein